jgi:hypothetical protein
MLSWQVYTSIIAADCRYVNFHVFCLKDQCSRNNFKEILNFAANFFLLLFSQLRHIIIAFIDFFTSYLLPNIVPVCASVSGYLACGWIKIGTLTVPWDFLAFSFLFHKLPVRVFWQLECGTRGGRLVVAFCISFPARLFAFPPYHFPESNPRKDPVIQVFANQHPCLQY